MAEPILSVSHKTLHEYAFDGHAPLAALIEGSSYGTIGQVVASLTLFSHPDTVRQTECRPVVRTIRNAPRRGEIVEIDGRAIGLDDNKSPTDAFMWCNAIKRRAKDIQFNHVYLNSQDSETYTCLANLCVTPSFLAKLTDTNPEIRTLLRYRVWDAYGWHPAALPAPTEPAGYGDLVWAPFLPPVPDVKAAFRAVVAKKPKDRTSVFVSRLGAFV